LQQVPGVGALTALYFVLKIEDPKRFKNVRDVGAYTGLCPRRDQSGASDPQLCISKRGDAYLRGLLVSAAQYILGPFGPQSALREYGLRLAADGTTRARKRAVVAVAPAVIVAVEVRRIAELDLADAGGAMPTAVHEQMQLAVIVAVQDHRLDPDERVVADFAAVERPGGQCRRS